MNEFNWPEPDLSFLPGTKALGAGEASYFICHNNLDNFTPKKSFVSLLELL